MYERGAVGPIDEQADEQAFTLLRPEGQGRFVLICDHASNHIPAELNGLGLPASERTRHIAWDIGAAGVATHLSALLDAPAILCGTSRLVVDCNRHLDAGDVIPEMSDGTPIPGNRGLGEWSRARRIERWFNPYHAAIDALLTTRIAQAASPDAVPMLLSIHSMTGELGNSLRPWQIAISSHHDRSIAEPMLAALRHPGDCTVGDNQPYDLDPAIDFSIPHHAMGRQLPYLQVEFRQTEIAEPAGQREWARRFAAALGEVV